MKRRRRDETGVSVILFALRALGYAITAPFAIISGLLVGGASIQDIMLTQPGALVSDQLQLCISLFLLSAPIYIFYTYRFPYDDDTTNDEKALTLLYFIAIICVLFAWIVGNGVFSRLPHLLIAVCYLMTTVLWSFRYIRGRKLGREPAIREWLAVPVLFSIGLGFVTGYSLANPTLAGSLWGVLPIAAIAAYFAMAFPSLRRESYIVMNAVILAALTVLALLGNAIPLPLAMSARVLIVAVVLSAFIASFESWRITAFHFEERATSTQGVSDHIGADSFYKSTTWAMACCILILPVMIIVLDYFHFLFYLTVLCVLLGGYVYWLAKALGDHFDSHGRWAKRKVWAGFTTLILIAADGVTRFTFGGWLVDPRFEELFAYPSLSLYVLALFYLCGSILREYELYKSASLDPKTSISRGDAFRGVWTALMNDPRTAGRLLGVASFAPFIILFLIDFGSGCSSNRQCAIDPESLGRLRAAELLYLAVSLAFVVLDYIERMFDLRQSEDFSVKFEERKPKRSPVARVLGFLNLTRFSTSMLVLAIVVAAFGLTGNGWARGAVMGVPFALAAMLGFVLNDIWDYRKDSVSKPHRAIPSGAVSLAEAQIVAALLSIASLTWAALSPARGVPQALYFVAIVGVVAYNYVVKYAAIAKSLLSALLSVSPLAFTMFFLHPTPLASIMVSLAVVYITGRELRMDILDLDGDRVDNIRTLPMMAGARRANAIASGLINASILTLCVAAIAVQPGPTTVTMAVVMLLGQAACESAWRYRGGVGRRISIKLQWLPMLAGSIFVLAST